MAFQKAIVSVSLFVSVNILLPFTTHRHLWRINKHSIMIRLNQRIPRIHWLLWLVTGGILCYKNKLYLSSDIYKSDVKQMQFLSGFSVVNPEGMMVPTLLAGGEPQPLSVHSHSQCQSLSARTSCLPGKQFHSQMRSLISIYRFLFILASLFLTLW